MDSQRIAAAAAALEADHAARRAYAPLPESLRPRDEDEAYAIQRALVGRWSAAGEGPVAGYKIALTTPAMQRMCNVDQPCAGMVLAGRVHQDEARVRAADHLHFGIEAEIAVLLAAPLAPDGAPWTRATVAPAIAACMAAIELVDDRSASYSGLDARDLIADNTWNAGIVLGPPRADWRDLDLAAARARMLINGREVGAGCGADVLGHPLVAVAWLANRLAGQGLGLAAGMVVMTGSMVTTKFLAPGDRATVEIDGLGAAGVTVE
jgi:2-keto-4-pentenoate hydratase